jgi:hypothetical protein
MADEKRQGAVCRKSFGKSASCHISVYRLYFLRYGFQQDNFSVLFSFGIFLFLEAVVKATLSFVGEVRTIQVVIIPHPSISDTSDSPAKAEGKVHACLSEQAQKADFVPFLFRLCLL